jgi:hypothetical protein
VGGDGLGIEEGETGGINLFIKMRRRAKGRRIPQIKKCHKLTLIKTK